jgi:plastocyanin
MTGRFAVVLAGLVLAAAGLAACGGGDGGGGDVSAGDNAGGGEEVPEDVVVVDTDPAPVTALDNSFRPENVEVAAGTEVVWTNRGRNEHNVLPAESDGWGVEADGFGPGDTYSQTFDEPGVYRYYCSLHGTENAGMIGALVVTEAGEAQG